MHKVDVYMETIKVTTKLFAEERETVIVYDNTNKKWYADTTLSKHVNKFKKQGWTQTAEYVYEDGTACGGVFEASDKGITIRNPNKKRVMSEKQMNNLHGHDDDEDEDEE
jgi:hypothetical protein